MRAMRCAGSGRTRIEHSFDDQIGIGGNLQRLSSGGHQIPRMIANNSRQDMPIRWHPIERRGDRRRRIATQDQRCWPRSGEGRFSPVEQ